MTFTNLIYTMVFCAVALSAHDACGAAQETVKGTTTAPAQIAQTNPVANDPLSKKQSSPLNFTVLQETKKMVPRLGQSETKHYVILSDTSPEDITMVGTLLEATFQKYMEVCDSLGWNLKQLRHKLVAVVFRDQRDYNDFATKNDKVSKSWAVGYYSPLTDRLVFYRADSSTDVKKVKKQLNEQDRALKQAEQFQQSAGRALHPNTELTQAKQQLAAEHDRINDVVASSFVSTAVHEAAHQLFFHTDIQRSGASYPLWLAEGLATNFETERIDIQFGYQVDNWRRRDSFKLAADKNSIIPLKVMLTQERFADGTDSNEAVGYFYAQAYALTNWLLRERPTELKLYLESLRDGSYALAQNREKNFEAIFGPVARLERNWVRYEGRRQKEFLASPFAQSVLVTMPTDAKPIPEVSEPKLPK